jgi:hypothetical protein
LPFQINKRFKFPCARTGGNCHTFQWQLSFRQNDILPSRGSIPPHVSHHLIVVVAFSRTDNGELAPAYYPMQFHAPEDAVRMARSLAAGCAGVLAWSREAQAVIGEYGPPTILFQSGEVPDME